MSESLNLEVPEEFGEWPHEAKAFVLAEANETTDLRNEIHALAGIAGTVEDGTRANSFSKEQLANLIIALGGPQGGDE